MFFLYYIFIYVGAHLFLLSPFWAPLLLIYVLFKKRNFILKFFSKFKRKSD